jgi:hypothetical protein
MSSQRSQSQRSQSQSSHGSQSQHWDLNPVADPIWVQPNLQPQPEIEEAELSVAGTDVLDGELIPEDAMVTYIDPRVPVLQRELENKEEEIEELKSLLSARTSALKSMRMVATNTAMGCNDAVAGIEDLRQIYRNHLALPIEVQKGHLPDLDAREKSLLAMKREREEEEEEKTKRKNSQGSEEFFD